MPQHTMPNQMIEALTVGPQQTAKRRRLTVAPQQTVGQETSVRSAYLSGELLAVSL